MIKIEEATYQDRMDLQKATETITGKPASIPVQAFKIGVKNETFDGDTWCMDVLQIPEGLDSLGLLYALRASTEKLIRDYKVTNNIEEQEPHYYSAEQMSGPKRNRPQPPVPTEAWQKSVERKLEILFDITKKIEDDIKMQSDIKGLQQFVELPEGISQEDFVEAYHRGDPIIIKEDQ